MADKTTAFALEVSSPSMVSQAIVLRDGTVARRMLSAGQVRTQWKVTSKDDPRAFVEPYLTTLINGEGESGPTITLCAVIEVAGDEVEALASYSFPRNLGLRFQRTKDRQTGATGTDDSETD